MQFHPLSPKTLSGVTKTDSAFPQFNLNDWNRGIFQEEFQTWFQKKIGLREYYIRLDNQINFSLFNECKSYKNAIVLGKNNWLYERPYINSYRGMDRVPRKELEKRIAQMKQLQDLLEKENIVFLFIISPSKATVYPEYLPQRYLRGYQHGILSNYDDVKELLDAYQVHYLDAHQYFVSQKNKAMYRLFLPGGTHWSHYGAYLFCLNIIDAIERQGNFSLGDLTGEPMLVDNHPRGTDRDLAGLMNVLDKHATDSRTAHPNINVSFSKNDVHPNGLIVGSSFSHQITCYMTDKLFNKRDLYYYYKRNMQYPVQSQDTSVPKGSELKAVIFKKQVVILEANESALNDIGCGFIQEAVTCLSSDSTLRNKGGGS